MELNSKKSNWADLYILYYKLPFINSCSSVILQKSV